MGDFFYKIIPVGSTFNSKISVWKFVFSMRMSTVFKKRDFSHLIIKVDTQKTKIGYIINLISDGVHLYFTWNLHII